MARQKEFDRDDALRSAMQVFREQGYGSTTTDELRHAMGIGRQSFYDTFKGKKEVYAEVLRLYTNEQMLKYLSEFRSSDSPLESIENILMTIPNADLRERKLACLGVSSICEMGDSNKEISAINRDAGKTLTAMLEKLIAEAQSKDEIRSSLKPESVSQFLITLLSGLKISARAGSPPDALARTVKLAIDGLK